MPTNTEDLTLLWILFQFHIGSTKRFKRKPKLSFGSRWYIGHEQSHAPESPTWHLFTDNVVKFSKLSIFTLALNAREIHNAYARSRFCLGPWHLVAQNQLWHRLPLQRTYLHLWKHVVCCYGALQVQFRNIHREKREWFRSGFLASRPSSLSLVPFF